VSTSPSAPADRSNRTVAMQLAAAFARHGVEVTFGQSIPTTFHLAAPEYGIRQAVYRAENAGGAIGRRLCQGCRARWRW